jgi:hypothetical protein
MLSESISPDRIDEARVAEAVSPEGLDRIHEPGVDLAIWRRLLPPELVAWLAALPSDRLPTGRVLVGLNDLEIAVAFILAESKVPTGTQATAFLEDVVRLARIFSRIVGSPVIDLRLEAIDHDSCWRFHRDAVRLRLLTTYRGPGTQIVALADAEEALKQQRDYRGPVRQLHAPAVALFKGNQAASGSGVVHRSPSIRGMGITRLLLCLNLPSDASPDLWSRENARKK